MVAFRCLSLSYLIGAGFESPESISSVLSGNTSQGVLGVIRTNLCKRESSTGKSLGGIGRIHLFDDNLIILYRCIRRLRRGNHDGLRVIIGVVFLAIRRCCITANVMIQGHVYIRPAICVIKDLFALLIEGGGAIFVRIDVGVAGAILCIRNIHQLFGNRDLLSFCVRRDCSALTQRTPAERLNPCVVIPNHVLVGP